MMNFFIGIIGGIFSSVIVSRVFLIITREDSLYQELRIIKERTIIFSFDVEEYISSIDEGNLVIGSKSELESRDKLKEKLFAYSKKCEQYIENITCQTPAKKYKLYKSSINKKSARPPVLNCKRKMNKI